VLVQNVPDNTSTTDAGAKASIQDANKPGANRQPPPLTNMLRSYVVYTMCCIPALVDWSPKILGTLLSIPVVGDVTELLVRVTFFAQVGYHVPSSFLI
jgi:proline dehydrogenase